MDKNTLKCSRCGMALTAEAPEGICPRCLLALNLATETVVPGLDQEEPNEKPAKNEPPSLADVARLFPQFEIAEYLGRGGMGVVYKARQPRLDRWVALKVLAKGCDTDPRFADRFTREARALARLNHPSIVTVYDFGDVDGHYFLVMEYVDGVNLRELVRNRRILPEQALAIVPKICEALQYAHEQGIVHRDIKPENILIDKEGRVKIADFGIAKMLGFQPDHTLTEGKQVVGTPHYMAPEQVEHPQSVDHRADIYSLGVVFYEMLTGELPLGKFASPSQKVTVDVRLDEVVLHALEKEPERRYQRASEFKADVETIAGGKPARDSNDGNPRKKTWKRVVAGASLAAVMICGCAYWLGSSRDIVVKGTVTDSATGKPIANARVADNFYNTSPTKPASETWTDSSGTFALKTQYEEHSIVASAPGYASKIATLMTSKGGSNALPRMDFVLQATQDKVSAPATNLVPKANWVALLNEDQVAVLRWTDRQFRKFFDNRSFEDWSEKDRTALETQALQALDGPHNEDYYASLGTLGALHSKKAVQPLLGIATDRQPKNNRDRWMAVRALGMIGDPAIVPDLILLTYHPNPNTRWWAQISLVRITGANFGTDWNAWGDWWNSRGGLPAYKIELVRWDGVDSGNPEAQKKELEQRDRSFLAEVKPRAAMDRPEQTPEMAPQRVPDPAPVAGVNNPTVLQRDSGLQIAKESLNASGEAVQFTRPPNARYVEAVQIYASRYGMPEAPKEDFHVYLLNEKMQILADVPFPYSMIERGDMRWYTLRTPSIEVPEQFTVALSFNAHSTKGVYLGYTGTNGTAVYSLIGLPDSGFETFKPLEWMIRVCLAPEPSKAKGFQALADWKAPVVVDPFATCQIVQFDSGKSDGMQSYNDAGPAMRFKPSDYIQSTSGKGGKLKGIRVYGSRYGSGYSVDETKLNVAVLDAKGGKILQTNFPYGKFSYRAQWVDLVFEAPVEIQQLGEVLTIALDPEATRFKGIYFHYVKNPAVSHSLIGKVNDGFQAIPEREWMIRFAFELE